MAVPPAGVEQKNSTQTSTKSSIRCGLLCHCRFRAITRTLTPATLWIIYLCLGSLMFTAIEDKGATKRREMVEQTQVQLAVRLHNLSEYLANNCSGSTEEQLRLVDAISVGLDRLLEEADFGPSTRGWDFFRSLRFCITAISTIGYGYLAPKTQLGRGLCIVYTTLGLPLNLIFMMCVGRHLALLIAAAYSRMRAFGSFIRALGKLGQKQHHNRKLDMENELTSRNTKSVDMVTEVSLSEYGKKENEAVKYSKTGTEFAAQYLQRSEKDTDVHSLSPRSVSNIDGSPSPKISGASMPELLHLQNNHHHDELAPDVPMSFLIVLIIGYCCLGAWFLRRSNPLWTFLDGIYFWFITITTVGFGDLEVSTDSSQGGGDVTDPSWIIMIQLAVIAFLVVGLALMSACVTLCIERAHHYRRLSGRFTCNAVNDTSQDQNAAKSPTLSTSEDAPNNTNPTS